MKFLVFVIVCLLSFTLISGKSSKEQERKTNSNEKSSDGRQKLYKTLGGITRSFEEAGRAQYGTQGLIMKKMISGGQTVIEELKKTSNSVVLSMKSAWNQEGVLIKETLAKINTATEDFVSETRSSIDNVINSIEKAREEIIQVIRLKPE